MAAPALCKFNQVGFCKFKSSCRNVHIVEICPRKECVDKSCSLRHPQRCRYYAYFGHCKFGEKCAYLHYSLNQDLETKLISMKEALLELREVTNTLVKTTDMQQLKMDVFNEEFTEYVKAVDEVKGKVPRNYPANQSTSCCQQPLSSSSLFIEACRYARPLSILKLYVVSLV